MIVFSKLKREKIFGDEFIDFKSNNTLKFGNKNIVILYGPNGTGKTSLAKALNSSAGCEFSLTFNGKNYTNKNCELFHIIQDQVGRNIIEGETADFLIGDDIRRELELKTNIDKEFKMLLKDTLPKILKDEFSIKKKQSSFIEYVNDKEIKNYINDIANNKSKGDNINKDDFINYIVKLKEIEIEEHDVAKYNFLISNIENNNSIIHKLLELENETFERNEEIEVIEHSDEAIKILSKFPEVNECIVCDNPLNVEEKLQQKKQVKEKIIKSLSSKTKEMLKELLKLVEETDPFCLKREIISSIRSGDFAIIEKLKKEIIEYLNIIGNKIINQFIKSVSDTQLELYLNEYNQLIESRPEFKDEDIIFIEHIINENIEKKIELMRDENNSLRLTLGGSALLNKGRDELALSNGEQNFISLAFELLKAKNSDKEIIVLDDPISSFDSIYKNKITFSIIKFLQNKKQIVLTHNVDLIRLIEHQKQNCFQLYLFNNTFEEANGFFELNSKEIDLLLYINKLIYFFRSNLVDEIEDERSFLISMVPFMRGYSQILCNDDAKNKLTSLMHGYNDECQNLVELYKELFGNAINFNETHSISAQNIIELDIDNLKILKDDTEYSLLDRTLKHTLTYLYLRLNVEKILSEKYSIDTQKYELLSQIIFEAFKDEDLDTAKKRVFLASKKTLLNEFNHFEGNMNIFQPAIDITNSALKKEKQDIIYFLNSL